MNLEDKMSTSRGWKLKWRDYIEDFDEKKRRRHDGGHAALLPTADSLKQKTEFTWKGAPGRAEHSELVAIFRNLSTTLSFLMRKLRQQSAKASNEEICWIRTKHTGGQIQNLQSKKQHIEQYKFGRPF